MLHSHFTRDCMYFFVPLNPCFVTKNCSKSSYICVFILSKRRHSWFYKKLYNSGMVGRRKLPDRSLNCIFNAVSIGAHNMLSFQWTNFGLKCLLPSLTNDFVDLWFDMSAILIRQGTAVLTFLSFKSLTNIFNENIYHTS